MKGQGRFKNTTHRKAVIVFLIVILSSPLVASADSQGGIRIVGIPVFALLGFSLFFFLCEILRTHAQNSIEDSEEARNTIQIENTDDK